MSRLVLILLVLASCGGGAGHGPISREAELARITDQCGLPRSSLRLRSGELHIQPKPDARYEAVECLLRELRESGVLRDTPMGFIGNEAPDANDATPH